MNEKSSLRGAANPLTENDSQYSAPADIIAERSEQDWVDYLAQRAAELIPAQIVAETEDERRAMFANEIYERLVRAHPATALLAEAGRAGTAPAAIVDAMKLVCEGDDGVDLLHSHLDVVLTADSGQRMAAIPQEERGQVMEQLRLHQRALRLTMHPKTAAVLIRDQRASSTTIMELGRNQFMTYLKGEEVSPVDAARTFRRAELTSAMVIKTMADFATGPELGTTVTPLLTQSPEQAKAIADHPTLARLFGSQDFCACDDCNSAYSPAAYLADLLRWLGGRGQLTVTGTATALAGLLSRRPDIGDLKLNCDNTNIELPYIDLVNELLEDRVAPVVAPADVLSRQTHGTSRERRALPEYENAAAYTTLAETNFPLQLPFDRSFDECTVLVGRLGSNLAEVIDAYAPERRLAVACAHFGLDDASTQLIVATAPAPLLSVWNVATVAELAAVPVLLGNALLAFEDLQTLAGLSWINAAGPQALSIAGIDDSCDTSKMTVLNLTEAHADRLNRLLRLWRKTPWSLLELDALIQARAVGDGKLDADTLIRLRSAAQLQESLNLSVAQLIGFYADLPTKDIDQSGALYGSVFQPVSPAAVLDPVLAADQVTATGVTTTTDLHAAAIAASLGITVGDLDRLLDVAFGASTPVPVSLANLSALWRWAQLSKALGVTVDELGRWQKLLETQPFDSLDDTVQWLTAYADIAASHVGLEDRERFCALVTLALPDTAAKAAIEEIRAVLAKIPEPDLSTTAARLVTLIPTLDDQASQSTAARLLAGEVSAVPADDATFVAHRVVPVLGAGAVALFRELESTLTPAERQQRIADRESRLSVLLRAIAVRNAILDVLSRSTGCSADLLRPLIDLVPVSATSAMTIYAALVALTPDRTTDDTRPLLPIEPDNFADAFAAVRRSAAIGGFAGALRLSAADLLWLSSQNRTRWSAPTALPTVPGELLPVAVLTRTIRLFVSLRPWARQGRSWAEILDLLADSSVAAVDLPDRLAALIPSVATLSGPRFLQVAADLGFAVADLAEPENLQRVIRTLALLDRLGSDSATTKGWAQLPPSSATATSMWNVLRARYASEEWLDELPAITDPLRERRRDALVAYLEPRPPTPAAWTDADSMFGSFLLHPRMAACLMTSRIVQTFASVQLYAMRVMMHCETELSGVTADATVDDGWLQWPARSEYPLWVANLQIWHYPENWLNQVDRPGKSEAFVHMEQELSGQNVDDATAEQALLRYFEDSDEVSRVRVIGFFDDRATGDVHVVARSLSEPVHHFYRRQTSGRWSPWERLNVDIRGDGVAMIVFRRKLHLFWAVAEAKPVPIATKQEAAAPSYAEVSLNWTSLRRGSWAPARTAPQLLYVQPPQSAFNVGLRLNATSRTLTIDAYSPTHVGAYRFDGRDVYAEQNLTDIAFALDTVPQAKPGSPVALSGPATLPSPSADLRWNGGRLVAGSATQPLQFTTGPGQFAPPGALLNSVTGPFSVLGPAQDATFDPGSPFFFEWHGRTWFVNSQRYYQKGSTFTPEVPSDPLSVPYNVRYRFSRFFYPYADLFFEQLDIGGLERLYRRQLQHNPNVLALAPTPPFKATFTPTTGRVKWGPDEDTLDYGFADPDFIYNMEPFVYAPVRIAEELLRNEKPKEALRFLGLVLDWTRPSSQTTAGRYWVPKIFADMTDEQVYRERINQLLSRANAHDPVGEQQIHEWWANPFQPFLVADMRMTAHMKSITMKTIDAHLAAGDKAFAQPSRSNLNVAALNYVTVSELLGPAPQKVTPPELPAMSFNELVAAPGGLDDFANFAADLENALPLVSGAASTDPPGTSLPSVRTFYFKVPPNPQLLSKWDAVADRMFKLRHCQDLSGQALKLPLLDPPIDPGVLARAVAAGLDISEVIASTSAPLPHERCLVVLARAEKVNNAVIALGHDLQSALDKRDAEVLTALRSSHEVSLSDLTREVRKLQIDEATKQLDASNAAVDVAEARRAFNAGQPKTYTGDDLALGLSVTAGVVQVLAAIPKLAAGAVAVVPKTEGGVSGLGAHATVAISGAHLSQAADKFSEVMLLAAAVLDRSALASTSMATHARRFDEHQATAKQADLEKTQLIKAVATASVKLEYTKKELEVFEKQTANTAIVDRYLQDKFTSAQLYDHTIDQLSGLFFQTYQLALELGRRAELCFRHELCVPESDYVRFGHWDSLRKGLLAGERLAEDLRRLESAYHDRNKRRPEITKTVSLLQLDPRALLKLKQTGVAEFDLPEIEFDGDHPGQYQRRLKSVSVTIPCVAGPYNGVHARLEMTAGSTRMHETLAAGRYSRLDGAQRDIRFHDDLPVVRSISTSSAVNDSGLFELNLHDDRYLPCEGGGAISSWRIEVLQELNDFHLSTISDVLLTLRLTALESGGVLREQALAQVRAARAGRAVRVFDLRRDFPDSWAQLMSGAAGAQKLGFTLDIRHLPLALRESPVKVSYDLVMLASQPVAVQAAAPLQTDARTSTAIAGLDLGQHVEYATATALRPVSFALAKPGGGQLTEVDVAEIFVFATFEAA